MRNLCLNILDAHSPVGIGDKLRGHDENNLSNIGMSDYK
jgi:hypothetical protein